MPITAGARVTGTADHRGRAIAVPAVGLVAMPLREGEAPGALNRPTVCALLVISLSACTASHRPSGSSDGDMTERLDARTSDRSDADVAWALDTAALDGGAATDAPETTTDARSSILERYRADCFRWATALCAGLPCCTRASRGEDGLWQCPDLLPTQCEAIVPEDPTYAPLIDGSVWYGDGVEVFIAGMEAARASCGAWPPLVGAYLEGNVGEGGDCTPTELLLGIERFQCRAGLHCSISGPSSGGWVGVCRPPGGVDAPCWSDVACLPDFYCRGSAAPWTEAERGRCRRTVAAGEPCDADAQCTTRLCEGMCVERLPSDDWCWDRVSFDP